MTKISKQTTSHACARSGCVSLPDEANASPFWDLGFCRLRFIWDLGFRDLGFFRRHRINTKL